MEDTRPGGATAKAVHLSVELPDKGLSFRVCVLHIGTNAGDALQLSPDQIGTGCAWARCWRDAKGDKAETRAGLSVSRLCLALLLSWAAHLQRVSVCLTS